MNTKAQESGTLQNLLVGAIVIGAFTVLSMTFISSLSVNYGVGMDENKYSVFNSFNETNTLITEMGQPIVGNSDAQPDSTSIIDTMVQAAYTSIKLFSSIPSIYVGLAKSAADALGLPGIVVSLVGAMIIVMIIFAAIALIMKVRA